MRSLFTAALALLLMGSLFIHGRRPQDKHQEHHDEHKGGQVKLTDSGRKSAGIEVVECARRTLSEVVHTTGTVDVNADRVAHLVSRLPGAVLQVSAQGHLGSHVSEGDLLALIHSVEFGKAQTDYRKQIETAELRRKTFERERDLYERKISSGKDFIDAEAELAQAKIDLEATKNQLEVLGLTPADMEAVAAAKAPLGCMGLRAPIHGTIIEKHVVKGEHVDTEHNLFTIANLDTLWVFADVYERDMARVAIGQSAEMRIAAYPERVFTGKIAHVAETMSVETRTLKVRIEVENRDGRLKPGMFASVNIAVGERANILAAPESAIQTFKQQSVVFVEEEPNVFEMRRAKLGIRFAGWVEILEGIQQGDKIVTSGSFLLKSELEKESFEAGHEH